MQSTKLFQNFALVVTKYKYLNDVLSLLKLYFYFNNLTLNENNIKKCIIELRNKVVGNYKGYIFCSSIIEVEI